MWRRSDKYEGVESMSEPKAKSGAAHDVWVTSGHLPVP